MQCLRDILLWDYADDEEYTQEIEESTDEELIERIEESVGTYFGSSYDGNGSDPLYIGVSKIGWSYWELDGDNGIIAWAKKPPTDEELAEWESVVPKKVKAILKKHGLEPRVFWFSSTS